MDRASKTPIALPVLLAALLSMAGAAGADVLDSIALAFVLLPACEAALAAAKAADEDAAPAVRFPRPDPLPRRTGLPRTVFPTLTRARAHSGVLDGVLLPLLT